MNQVNDRILKSDLIDWRSLKFLQSDKFKKLPRQAREALRESIKNNDFVESFKVWNDGDTTWCLDGKHRVEVMKELESEGVQIPEKLRADFIDCPDRNSAAKLVLIYSSKYAKITEMGMAEFIRTYDLPIAEFRDQILIPDFDFRKFEKKISLEQIQEDTLDASQVPVRTISTPGDIYQLNEHRVMCGDATNGNDIKALAGPHKATLVFTDPPYGVDYSGADQQKIKNDNLGSSALTEFLYCAFVNLQTATNRNPAIYCFYASRNHIEFETAMNRAGIRVKQQIIWSKQFALSRSDYHWSHEPCLYAIFEGNNCAWHTDRTEKTVNELDSKELEKITKEEAVEILRRLKDGATVWAIKKDSILKYMHPTQKPIALSARAILNNTKYGEPVLDPFAGSGSTLMGAEQTGRIGLAMELDPKFCDIIIKRRILFKRKEGETIKVSKNGRELSQEQIDEFTAIATRKMSDSEKEQLTQIKTK